LFWASVKRTGSGSFDFSGKKKKKVAVTLIATGGRFTQNISQTGGERYAKKTEDGPKVASSRKFVERKTNVLQKKVNGPLGNWRSAPDWAEKKQRTSGGQPPSVVREESEKGKIAGISRGRAGGGGTSTSRGETRPVKSKKSNLEGVLKKNRGWKKWAPWGRGSTCARSNINSTNNQ